MLANERPDLEISFTEHSEEIWKAIVELRGVQDRLVTTLDADAKTLLGGEGLIQTLNESQQTAEYIAEKCRSINSLNV